ncbi:MAG: hypothetical protein GY932_14485 [Arcobacter sp.]|nr:hypothetical protein [Arcobacter sp.]
MKKIINVVLILFLSNSIIIFGQKSSHMVWEKKSENEEYTSRVLGKFYEGFVGTQTVRLFYKDSLLWEKEIEPNGLHLPCVSNNGDIVITKWNDFFLFDKSDSLIWNYKLPNETFCNPISESIDIVQAFSEDNKYYFAVVYDNKSKDHHLICNSILEKKEKWRINLNTYYASDLILVDNLIVLHDLKSIGKAYENKLRVINYDGEIVWDYERKLNTDIFKNIEYDKSSNTIKIIFEDEIVKNVVSSQEKKDSFFFMDSLKISLFHGFNNIDSIHASNNQINFYSKEGSILLSKALKPLKIDTTKTICLQKNNEKNIFQQVPENFRISTYSSVKDRSLKNNQEIVLMQLASEGGYSTTAVFDTVNNKVLPFLKEPYQSIDFDDESIYLGQKFGFSILDREKNNKLDYILLPTFNEKASIKIVEDDLFLAINKLGIQKIKLNSDSIDFWTYDDLIDQFPSIKKLMVNDDGFPIFTNFTKVDSLLFIGCRVVQDYWMGYTRNKGSILFVYNLFDLKWNAICLDLLESVAIIKFNNNKIWFGGHQVEESEGDDPILHGGVGYYDLKTKEIIHLDSIPKNHLSFGFTFKDGDAFSKIWYDGWMFKYKIDQANNVTKIDSTIHEDYSNIIFKRTFSPNNKDFVLYSNQLHKMKFIPRILLKSSSKVDKIETYR